jgi:GntR family transcriptional regulator, galactonate operon transcriptional repressor
MSTVPSHADVIQLMGHAAKPGAERLFDQVVEKLAFGILTGRYPVGDVLPNEVALANELTVSRSAYREALKFLSSKGLIEAKPRTGTRVRPPVDWNMLDPDILRWSLHVGPSIAFARDLFELRRTIEPEATRLAAIRRSDEDVDSIEDALLRMERLTPLSAGSISADLEFHERIFVASGNRALACLKSVVGPTILWSQNVKRVIGTEEFLASLADHRRIFEAIVARDGELAAAQSVMLITGALNTTTVAIEVEAAKGKPTGPSRRRTAS